MFKDNVFRAALFSEDIRCMVFPPLVRSRLILLIIIIRDDDDDAHGTDKQEQQACSLPLLRILLASAHASSSDSARAQVHFPGIGELAQKDLRGYVSAGNNAVFVGSYEWLSIMNDVFGFQVLLLLLVLPTTVLRFCTVMCPRYQLSGVVLQLSQY